MAHEESTPGLDALIEMDKSNQPLHEGETELASEADRERSYAEAVRTCRASSATLAQHLLMAAAVLIAALGIGWKTLRPILRPVAPVAKLPRSKWLDGTETFANSGKTKLPFEESSTGPQASRVVDGKIPGTNMLYRVDRRGDDLRVEVTTEQSEVPELLIGIAFFEGGRTSLFRQFALLGKEGPGLKGTALLPMKYIITHRVVAQCEIYLIAPVPPESLTSSDFKALNVAIRRDPSRFDDWKAWFAGAERRMVRDLREPMADFLRSQSLLGIGRQANIDSAVPADVDAFDRQRIHTLADQSSLLLTEDDVPITTVGEAHSLSLIDSHSVHNNGEVIIMCDAQHVDLVG